MIGVLLWLAVQQKFKTFMSSTHAVEPGGGLYIQQVNENILI